MSTTLEERTDRWEEWTRKVRWDASVNATGQREPILVGFIHQCGEATLVSDFSAAMISCAGCRFLLDRPEECEPIFRLEVRT